MRSRRNFLASFFVLFFAAFVLFILWKWTPVRTVNMFIDKILSPVEFSVTQIFSSKSAGNSPLVKLENENKKLLEKQAKLEVILKENKALSDQFQAVYPKSSSLLPAKIVGRPSFIPGVTSPLRFVIDKGRKDGVKKGQAVVVRDNLVGEIQDTNDAFSIVSLATNNKFSITAKTLRSGALGVVRGEGSSSISFGNILPSADLKKGDIVVTAGSLDISGLGIPPELIIGRIFSVAKNPSAIFQSADIKSLIDFSTLSMVFVIIAQMQ